MSEYLNENNEIFGGWWWNDWRKTRVQKLQSVLAHDKDNIKTVLECGAGFGNVGMHFKTLGFDVTMSDIRDECLDEIKKRDAEAKVIKINHERDWTLSNKFDLVIHFGLSCHLENWKQDLLCAINSTSKWLVFETAVNKFKDDISFVIENPTYQHEYHGPAQFEGHPTTGSLPSVNAIENVLDSFKVTYDRYDDTDLNIHDIVYTNKCNYPFEYPTDQDGEINEAGPFVVDGWDNAEVSGGRKYWVIKKNLITI